MDIGDYVSAPSYHVGPAPFLRLLVTRVAAILQEHHLVLATDVYEGGGTHMPSFLNMLDLSPDDEDEYEDEDDEKPEYDDRPGIDKLLSLLTTTSRRAKAALKRPPQLQSHRILGCHPATCAVLVAVGISVLPIKAGDDAAGLTHFGSWTMHLDTSPGEALSMGGSVRDQTSLAGMFDAITLACANMRKEHDLQPRRRGPGEYLNVGAAYAGGGPEDDLPPNPFPVPTPVPIAAPRPG